MENYRQVQRDKRKVSSYEVLGGKGRGEGCSEHQFTREEWEVVVVSLWPRSSSFSFSFFKKICLLFLKSKR